jgi:hypothetical protein
MDFFSGIPANLPLVTSEATKPAMVFWGRPRKTVFFHEDLMRLNGIFMGFNGI